MPIRQQLLKPQHCAPSANEALRGAEEKTFRLCCSRADFKEVQTYCFMLKSN